MERMKYHTIYIFSIEYHTHWMRTTQHATCASLGRESNKKPLAGITGEGFFECHRAR
ncbi:protein of unknown function [Pararobbsia alpina]